MDKRNDTTTLDPTKELEKQFESCKKKLKYLIMQYDSEHLYCSLQILEMLKVGEDYNEVTHGYLSSYFEIAAFYMFGIKSSSQILPNVETIAEITELIKCIQSSKMFLGYGKSFTNILDIDLQSTMLGHAANVRGSGYAEQTCSRITDVFFPFASYFEKDMQANVACTSSEHFGHVGR